VKIYKKQHFFNQIVNNNGTQKQHMVSSIAGKYALFNVLLYEVDLLYISVRYLSVVFFSTQLGINALW